MPPPVPKPINIVPQFDAFTFDGKLYSLLVAKPEISLFIGYDPKAQQPMPFPPGTPVTQVPSPGFGLIILLNLPMPLGMLAAMVADGTLTQEDADAINVKINEAQQPTTAPQPTISRGRFMPDNIEAGVLSEPTAPTEEPEEETERRRIRVGQFGSGFEEE